MNLRPGNLNRIAIFRALQLGDMLCAIPAIRALRMSYPDAEITLIGLPWAASFVRRFNKFFDSFICFPGYAGLPEQEFSEAAYADFLYSIRQDPFDLLIQMQGNGTIVNPMLLTWNARQVAGFFNQHSFVNSELFVEYPNGIPEIHRHLILMQHLGISAVGDHLEFAATADDYDEFTSMDLALPSKSYVCIHPGSRGRWRQWPPKLFAQLADVCAAAGLSVVVTGTSSEADITKAVRENMKHPSIDLTGATTLGSLAMLLRNARLLVSNCTGVSHMAAATQTPSVVVSMDGEPERWAPLNRELHRTIDCRSDNRFDDVMRALEGQLAHSMATA